MSEITELSVWAWKKVASINPESSSKSSQLFGERTGRYKLRLSGSAWELFDNKISQSIGQGTYDESQFSAKTSTTNGANLTFKVDGGSIDIFERGGGATLFNKGHRSLARQAEIASKGQAIDKTGFTLDIQSSVLIEGIFIGGAGVPLEPGQEVTIKADKYGLTISQGEHGLWHKSYEGLIGLQASGEGLFQTGGGWVGGGFGVAGALKGAAFASIMNALTTRTHIDCLVRFVYPGVDASFKILSHTPEDLQIALSGVRNWLETSNKNVGSEANAKPINSLPAVEEIERYWALYEKGAISKAEYEKAKKKLEL